MDQSLYEKIGGEEAIAKVVDYFYNELVLKEESVAAFFKHTDIEKQIVHQTKFISFALGGPSHYSGRSMAKAHQGMNIQPSHFESIATHLHDALAHFHIAESDIEVVLHKVASLKDDIVKK
ncbi:group 1 truncated hemoglobin [Alkalihalobacillus sp. MEB130]|uniref:group I truncated hemoglobin n=1 Tax=Alkalihalobacillus sp. MEB130 TaxID=2976704 RepID=UPI0028DE2098|nr:group 1 truncated hemoglobin [Alkalihalobacillus sp. MEB130]MDT8861204.1 group 1 truncated hemoglobin [Alkalihalobacillus sp. MEB130]